MTGGREIDLQVHEEGNEKMHAVQQEGGKNDFWGAYYMKWALNNSEKCLEWNLSKYHKMPLQHYWNYDDL